MNTILYVEDHPPAQLLMRAIIAEMPDATLLIAGSGMEARRLANEHHPALYIVDLDLPDGDGVSLAADLRKLHAAPALLVSAYAEAVSEQNLTSNITAYLAKPLDPDDVETAIRRALARSA
ncbi:MAG: response regulator [Anaerolineae bacterium]|nr:response regulator [Anaerolineae bacterium]